MPERMEQGQCLFCAVAAGQIPSKKVYEDSVAMAFLDINPRNRGHTLVISKKHYETLMDMSEEEAAELFRIVRRVAVAAKEAVEADGITIGQNNGKVAGQAIPHMHFHVIPRFETDKVKAGAEALLPPVKLEETEMNDIMKKIKENMEYGEPKKKEPKKQEQPKKEAETKEPEEEEQKQDEEETKKEDFKKIDFNF